MNEEHIISKYKSRLQEIINSIIGLSKQKKKDLYLILTQEFDELSKRINDNYKDSIDKIRSAIENLINDAPEAYDTLKELYEGLIVQPDWNENNENKLSFIKNKPDVVQSDYDQNDDKIADFIKNRPFYSQDTFELNEIVLNSGENKFSFKEENNIIYLYWDGVKLPFKAIRGDIGFGSGNKIVWDSYQIDNNLVNDAAASIGISSKQIWITLKTLDGLHTKETSLYIRNSFNIVNNGLDSYVGFAESNYNNGWYNGSSLNITPNNFVIYSIHGWTKNEFIKKIDKKFIPDEIEERITNLEEIQIDFDENDSTKKGYIKNRTHYEEKIQENDYEYVINTYDSQVGINQSPANKLGYKLINVNNDEYVFEFYKNTTLIYTSKNFTRKPYIQDLVKCRTVVLTINNTISNNISTISFDQGFALGYSGIDPEHLYQTFFVELDNDTGIKYIKFKGPNNAGINFASLIFDRNETIVHQLDIKYIPDSLIQRIEACEQALNITPNS